MISPSLKVLNNNIIYDSIIIDETKSSIWDEENLQHF